MSVDSDKAHRDRPLTRILEEEGRQPDHCPICASSAILERSGRFPEAWVDRLIQSVDLERLAVDLRVGGAKGLKRSGGSWVGECPACTGDAFNVTPKKGIWKCFKCGKGGNAATLIQLVEQCEFPEAVRYLAKFSGVAIEYENERQKLRCTRAGCPASTEPMDEVGYLMHSRNLSKAEAYVIWLQEAGVKRGESHSPSLMLPGRRKGKVHELVNEVNAATTPDSEAPVPSQPVEPPAPEPAAPAEPAEVPAESVVVPFPSAEGAPAAPPSPLAPPPDTGSRLVFDETELPGEALREFWSKIQWLEQDAIEIWRRRGLTPHTARVAGLRSNDRRNLDVLKSLSGKYPVDVLVQTGLWQRHEPDGPAWLQSESEAGVQVIGGARPSEFFYGKGQVGTIRRGREKVPEYGWNRAPIIPYFKAGNPDRQNDFTNPKALVTEGEFKALAVWQVHGITPGRLAEMRDPDPKDLVSLRPHKHWPKGASPLPYLCPDGNLPLRVAALPGITFCRLRGGAWSVRYHLDEWLKSRAVREVMIAYDNDDRVSRWRCPTCGNTDVALHKARLEAEQAQGEDLFAASRSPKGLRSSKPTCCGKPMKESPNFKEDESDRWDAVLYAIVLGQELEKLGLDARFMLIPDELRNHETGKCDWDAALASMLFSTRQESLPMDPGPGPEPDPSEDQPPFEEEETTGDHP